MGVGRLLERLRAHRLSTSQRRSPAPPPPRRRPLFERLEDRVLLSAVLYIDYGDAFAGGVLDTTVGAIDSTVSGSNPNIDGPRLSKGNVAYGDGTAVRIEAFNAWYPGSTGTDMRAAIDQFVTRFYAPLDITVVDLTTTAQNVNGHMVSAADSLDDISVTLGLNELDTTKNNDTYVIVGKFTIDPSGTPFNPADSEYGGISTGTDIGSFNNNDGTALVLLVTGKFDTAAFLGPQVAHEAGHAFGLRHTFGNDPRNPPGGSSIDGGLLDSDLMSYRAYDTFGGFDFFTRYPMVQGDGNLNNDTLAAAGGALTPFDQFFIDPNIGPSNMSYVTGTGQNDIITIAGDGTVTVQAFTDAAYTNAIEVPGTAVAGSVFTYSIDLTKPLLIDGGGRNDRIVLDADLGTTVTVRGMHGTDSVVVRGKGAASGSYTPGSNTANGLDNNADYRGSIVIGSTTINFQEFEVGASGSTVTIQDVGTFTFLTPLPSDVLTLGTAGAGQNRVTGTSGGVTIVPMTFFNVASVIIDTGGGDDTLTVPASGFVAAGLQNFTFNAGSGNDLLILNLASYALPGAFTYLGGSGSDEIRATADASFTLSDTSLGISTGGAVVLSSVNVATLTGGGSANSFSVSGWTGTATLRGLGGDDSYAVTFVGSGAGTVVVQDSGGTDALDVNGTAGADTLAIGAASVARDAESVSFNGIEDLTVDAKGGDDLITVSDTGPATTVLGGGGDDDFVVNGAGPAGVTLNGEGGSDDYTVNFGGLGGVVNVADSPLGVFDRLFVNGTSVADVLLIAPTFVKRGSDETVNYSGIEELDVDAGAGDDDITVDGTSVPTNVYGGLGDDDFIVNGPMAAALHLDGGPGTDSLLFNGTSGDDVIVLTDGSISGLGASISFVSIENLVVDAGAGDDVVDGSALTMSVTIYGGTGDDTLIGGSNDDHIYGEEDNDDIIGNLGADYLDGGTGSDGIVGDKGTIVREIVTGPEMLLAIPSGKLAEMINVAGDIRRVVTLIDPEQGGRDTLLGGDGRDYLHGGAGDDSLSGGDGDDAMFGDLGNDVMAGGNGDDHLYGGAGDDDIDGNAGADIAYGGDGDDRLVADSAADRLIDWLGNFNAFDVPGPGYGAPTIVRSPSPWVQDFVLRLAQDDGAANPNAEIVVVVPGGSLQQANSGR